MQDLHAVVGGRMFDAAAAMDKRLRPLSHHHALKCPRCDSLNTKFCYYNNYNLSQPRHFCKGCRRYWTNGGVLRNVPVGGGCRKNKRSKVKISPGNTADEVATTTTTTVVTSQQIDRKSSSHSSSESSGGYTAAAEAVCGSTSAGVLYTQLEYESLAAKSNSGGACFGHGDFTDIGGLIAAAAAASEPNPGGFNFNFSNRALLSQQSQDTCQQNQWQQQDQIPGTFLDQTVQVDLAALQSGFGPLDWQPCKDQGGVDLASGTVDQAYWCQSQIQWTDNNHSGLYLP